MRRFGRRVGVIPLAALLVLSAGCDGPTGERVVPKPHHSPATPPAGGLDRTVRVLLADKVTKCGVSVPGQFDLLDADRRTPLQRNVPAAQFTIEFRASGIAFPALQRSFDVEAVDILPHGSDPLAVAVGDGWPRYKGLLRVCRNPDNTGAVVNALDVEEYLVSVVFSEVPGTFHREAFRAQAVASRTYAWYQKRMAPASRRWDLMATEASQVYVGVPRGPGRHRAAAAVQSTCGVVCTWMSPRGERIFCSYFSSTCGGYTQAAGPVKNEATIPPLAGNVSCDYCAHSPWCEWGPVKLSKGTVTQRLRQKYTRFRDIGRIEKIEVVDRAAGDRPVRLRFADAKGRGIQLEAENFRLAVDPTGRVLRSTFFKVRSEDGYFVFSEGRGFGHGLGLCQYGADGMAQAGANATYILKYYYPHSRLKRAY